MSTPSGADLRELAKELNEQSWSGSEVTLSSELTRRLADWLESSSVIADLDRSESKQYDRATRKAFAFLRVWRATP